MGRQKKKKNNILKIIIALIAILVLAVFGYTFFMNSMSTAVNPADSEIISVEIPMGSNVDKIADILKSNGLIKSEFVFVQQSKMSNYASKFKAGNYGFSKDMNIDNIMTLLLAGVSADTVRFTIPEGFDLRLIKARLVEQGLLTAEAFDDEVENGVFDYQFVKDLPKGKVRLEGFLYPETYEVYKNATAHEILDKMLKQFDKLFTQEYYDRAKEMGMTINEVVTFASVIEREAMIAEDRPVISSVFHNRLEKKMALQSCATIQYILGEQKAKLTIADTQIPSPYNTYINSGLPPGPICSPQIKSIYTTLYPADTDYLYFLAKGDGGHVFSLTYNEHLANKKKYID